MQQSPAHNYGTPSENWASGHEKRRDGTAWVPAMIVGAVIFGVGCGSGLLAGWFAGAASSLGDLLGDMSFEPAAVTIDTAIPDTVTAGEPFEMVITVTDTAGEQRLLQDIDFSGSICDNIRFVSITPAPASVDTSLSYREHTFNRTLDANASTDFVFELVADQPGTYTSEITVYMDDYNSEYTTVTIEAKPQE